MDNVKTVTTDVVENTTTIEKTIKAPVFVMFAEFLGYTSPVVDWAEKVCFGKEIKKFQKDFIRIDAIGIFNQMLKESLTKEDIKGWYDEYYDLILKKYDDKLVELAKSDDLPF